MEQIIIITGPTAVGKTKYALALAETMDGEIVSADSMQIYRGMDIGSAKPSPHELSLIKHHLIDIADPREPFTVAEYQKLAKPIIFDILERGKVPIVSGGTGLYINSLIYEMDFTAPPGDPEYRRELEKIAEEKGPESLHEKLLALDPAAGERIHPNNSRKVIRALELAEQKGKSLPEFTQSFVKTKDYFPLLLVLSRDRKELYEQIELRVDQFMEAGLLQEVERLLSEGLNEKHTSMQGIGYKEVIAYLKGRCDLGETIEKIKQNTRRYAKRQLTWFRRYEEAQWFNLSEYRDDSESIAAVTDWIEARGNYQCLSKKNLKNI